jgi:hypothetical protein
MCLVSDFQFAPWTPRGYTVAQLVEALRYTGSIPDGVIGIFH